MVRWLSMKHLALLAIACALLVGCAGSSASTPPTWTPEAPKKVQMTIEVAPTSTATDKPTFTPIPPTFTPAASVIYKSGPSTAAGLGPKTAGGDGVVSWTWKVGTRTTTGTWPININCNRAGALNSHSLCNKIKRNLT